VYRSSTGVQGNRCCTGIKYVFTTGVQVYRYRYTGVVQCFSGTSIVYVFRGSRVLGSYNEYRSCTGVQSCTGLYV